MIFRTHGVACAASIITLLVAREATAQAGVRNFDMSVMSDRDGTEGDHAFFDMGSAQPAGRSVVDFPAWDEQTWAYALAGHESYDFSRIDAVLIDEPYWNATKGGLTQGESAKNPCDEQSQDSQRRCSQFAASYARLQALASAIKQTSPRTRLWINLSQHEVHWMGYGPVNSSPALELYGSWVDVISMDLYGVDFDEGVREYYDFIVAHRKSPAQQIALVPGTHVRDDSPAGDRYSGVRQAARLQGFFDYAWQMNQNCDLPLGGAITGSFDGCLVWSVAGWPASLRESTADEPAYYGLNHPKSKEIRDAWARQRAYPIRESRQAIDAAVTSITYPMCNY